MKTVTASMAIQIFGEILESVQSEPILVKNNGQPSAVIISANRYNLLRCLNRSEFSDFCSRVGKKARALGLTENTLNKLLAAKN